MRRPDRLPRGRRGVPATLVALALLAVATLAAIAAFQIAAGQDRTVLGGVAPVARRLRTHDWTDVAVLVTGIGCAALGAVLLLAGLLPARRTLLQLTDVDPTTVSGITRAGLRRDLAAVAARVDGVDSARVSLRGRRARVRARSPLRDVTGVREAVLLAVGDRLVVLAPVRPITVRVRVRAGG